MIVIQSAKRSLIVFPDLLMISIYHLHITPSHNAIYDYRDQFQGITIFTSSCQVWAHDTEVSSLKLRNTVNTLWHAVSWI